MKKLATGLISGFACITSIWAGCDSLDFARALEQNGYSSLASKYFEESLKENVVSDKEKDDVYLRLYKIFSRLAAVQTGDVADAMTKKAEGYFNQIKDSAQPEVQLEKVKADMESLRRMEHTVKTVTPQELPEIKKKTSELFLRVAGVTDGVRKSSRKWLDEYDSLDEKDQNRKKDEYRSQSELEINASLQFGEACVVYASVVGSKDPEVRRWLENMAKSYNDFIANNYGSFAAIVGGVYFGQVSILLEKYKDDYGKDADGIKEGERLFDDAIAGLQELSGQRKLAPYVNNWMLQAYTKQSQALSIIGQEEKSIDVLKKLFDWKAVNEADPKDSAFHDQMMFALQNLCQKLKASYDKGNKQRVNDFVNFTMQGFNFTKKTESRWYPNFKKLLSEIPTSDENIVETLDIAYMKAGDLYSNASRAEGDQQKELFFKAALKYKKVVEMCMVEGKERLDEMFPLAAYRLGTSYMSLGNNLLALGIYLRAVDLYPSTKFNEAKFPEIYRNIRKCAISAKSAAIRQYKLGGKRPFDQGLYEQTLKLISQQFPEEGGDPEFWLGYLRKSAGDYDTAIELLSKIGPKSKMYYKSQFALVDCEYQKMTDLVEAKKLEGDALAKKRAELATQYEKIAQLTSKELKKPVDMEEKDFKFMLQSKADTLSSSYQRMAALYYQAGDYAKAYKSQSEMFEKARDDEERFASLRMMISSAYKLDDLSMIDKDLAAYEKLKAEGDLTEYAINAFKASAYQMKANLVIKLELNPVKLKTEGLKGASLKAAEAKLHPIYIKVADLFYQSLLLTGDKKEDILRQVIAYYYTAPLGREKALEAMNLYFKWYPNKPELDIWYAEMLGKGVEAWDLKMGGILKSKFTNLPVVEKTYLELLDQLFDSQDYSQMSISQVRDVKKKNSDEPRSYQAALGVYEKLEGLSKKDLTFAKSGWPLLKNLKSKLEEANGYYAMRLQQAECLSLLKRYDEASDVFKELSHYFVEYPQIRIELAKAEFAQGTPESYARALTLFNDLLNVVATPNVGGYEPKGYFSLQWWLAKTKLAIAGGAKAPVKDVVEIWKGLRTPIYQDLGYIAKEAPRFASLKIEGPDRVVNEALIDDIKAWVDEVIFPVLKTSGDSVLSDDSWKKILGVDQ